MSPRTPRPKPHPPRPLERWLGTMGLMNLAQLDHAMVLTGQDEPGRRSTRKQYPGTRFYGDVVMRGGLMGHSHDWPELATVLQGRLNFGIGQSIYEVRQGDWLLLRPNVIHGECCLASRSTYWLLWIGLKSQHMSVQLTRYNRAEGYRVQDSHRVAPPPSQERAVVERLLAKPWRPVHEVRRDLLRFVTGRLELMAGTREPSVDNLHPLVAEALALIRARGPKQPLSVVELADRVGLSPNYLSNLFHQQIGRTIRQYIEHHRIEQAKASLAQPEQSIKHVAYALGFADPHHFSHVFRRVTGMSPSQYRARF